MGRDRRCAVVVPGYQYSGGVARVADFFSDAAKLVGLSVLLVDIAVSRSDPTSGRLLQPSTWFKPRLVHANVNSPVTRSGSLVAELEPVRYFASRGLHNYLNTFDLVQIVSGTPAWANLGQALVPPVALQVATTTRWERAARDRQGGSVMQAYRRSMTTVVDRLDERGVRVPSHIFVENHEMERWVLGRKGHDCGVTLAYPGIDTHRFRPPLSGWSRQGPLVSVGRLGEVRKGWPRLLRAYRALLDVTPSSPDLVLAGAGELTSGAHRVLHALELIDRVHITRDLSDLALVKLLQSASLFVTAAYEEGLGLAALEAMSCGLPVVAAKTAGSLEYVAPEGPGLLLPQDDREFVSGFPGAVAIALSNGPQWSIDSRHIVEERFSADGSRAAVARTYLELLS